MDGDDVAVLHTEVVAHNTVDADTSVIQIIVRQNNKNGIFSLLSLHEDLLGRLEISGHPKAGRKVEMAYSVAPEELEGLHGVVGQSNNRVIIVDGIRDAVDEVSGSPQDHLQQLNVDLHQRIGLLLLLEDGSRSVELL